MNSKTSLKYIKTGKGYGQGGTRYAENDLNYTNESASKTIDIDKEFAKLDGWKQYEGYYSGALVAPTDGIQPRVGRPFVVSISGSVDLEDSSTFISGSDLILAWSYANGVDSSDGYICRIPYGTFKRNTDFTVDTTNESVTATDVIGHHKGVIAISGSYPTGVGAQVSSDNLIVPKVKTLSLVTDPGNTTKYEEVYDSASIDIRNGEVTVYSDINSPLYLVLIY